MDDHYDATTQYTAGAPRFEFGLQNYASMAAVDATTRFLSAISAADAASHFVTLNATATELLSTLPGVRFIGPSDPAASSHIRNFYIDGADMRRVAEILDNAANTSVRVGKMCAHHTYHTYQLPASIRLSFGYHNTVDEVARCCRMLPDILKHYAG